jgi:hypothetical protein
MHVRDMALTKKKKKAYSCSYSQWVHFFYCYVSTSVTAKKVPEAAAEDADPTLEILILASSTHSSHFHMP